MRLLTLVFIFVILFFGVYLLFSLLGLIFFPEMTYGEIIRSDWIIPYVIFIGPWVAGFSTAGICFELGWEDRVAPFGS